MTRSVAQRRLAPTVHTLRIAIAIVWLVFWVYWLGSAFTAKASVGRRRSPFGGVTLLAIIIIIRVLPRGSFTVHSPVLGAVGAVVLALGLALAVWARVHLGRNWGMPMTERADPELVTSGPYHSVRHPIYSGLLLGLLGTALATNLLGLLVLVAATALFAYSATVEERNLTATFPAAYPAYREHTKMLIPFVL
jgi:protein-S-isoprenylcysteine O-methyltransferase Ste14